MPKIVTVPSQTIPRKNWYLKVDEKTRQAYECNCPVFLFRNPLKKPCKHIVIFNEVIRDKDTKLPLDKNK